MKFNLKIMLIGVGVVGVTIGVLGKLYIERPEDFFRALDAISAAGPFLLAIGTILWLGLRRVATQQRLACGRCGKELDSAVVISCPNCDPVSKLKQSQLFQRQWRLIVWAIVLLLVYPLMQLLITNIWGVERNPLALLSTDRLIHNRLPTQLLEPWVWNELENRLNAGNLSQSEVEQSIQQLIDYMNAIAGGWHQPLTWESNFIKAARKAQKISDKQFFNLCDAFYGSKPDVLPNPLMASEKHDFQLQIQYGSPWSADSGLGVVLIWEVTAIRIDGQPANFRQSNRLDELWVGRCECNSQPGDHQVEIDVECAYVDPNLLSGVSPSQVPVAQWPTARKRWSKTITVPLNVESVELNK